MQQWIHGIAKAFGSGGLASW